MTEQDINAICWWIPFRKLRGYFRDYLNQHFDDRTPTYAAAIPIIHQKTFSQFKNIHNGQDIVIVASGPTAKKYKPKKDATHICVNASFKIDGIKPDYLFITDYGNPTPSYIKEANNLNCVKFYGQTFYDFYKSHKNMTIPEQYKIEAKAYPFIIKAKSFIEPDISVFPLFAMSSVTTTALHFALYTNPKNIYLVGCDSSTSGYAFESKDKKNRLNVDGLQKGYTIISEFQKRHYPETNIYHVNPVGIKDIFNDIYIDE